MAKEKATPPRKAAKYVWIPEGTYRSCVIWFPLLLSARSTRREARQEMVTHKAIYDFDEYRLVKFAREGRNERT